MPHRVPRRFLRTLALALIAASLAGGARAQDAPAGVAPGSPPAAAAPPKVESWDRSRQTDGARPVEARLIYRDLPTGEGAAAGSVSPDSAAARSGAPVRNRRDRAGDIAIPREGPRCGGGGLVGGVNCVAERIARSGLGGSSSGGAIGALDSAAPSAVDPISPLAALERAETAAPTEQAAVEARAGILVRPQLREVGGRYEVTLEIGQRRLQIPDAIDEAKKATITRDSQIAHLRLINWKKTLTPDETKQFERERILRIPVEQPFQGLQLLALLVPVEVTVALPGGGTRLRFVELGDRAFVPAVHPLQYGRAYFVEALFEKPPESRYSEVALSWTGGESKFQMLQTQDNPRLYRSQRFYLRETDAQGRAVARDR